MVQYHGIILKKQKVARIGTLNKSIFQEQAIIKLDALEDKLRKVIRSRVTWNKDAHEYGVIKIWYYEENDNSTNVIDKRNYPPLRFSITVANITPLNELEGNKVKNLLEKAIVEWLKIVLQ